VIPGGSEGIGACIAEHLAASGINVVLIARKPEPLAETAAKVKALGVQVRTLSLDMTAPDMLAKIREVTDDIEVGLLVYNAGASHKTGSYIDWQLEDIVKVIRLNTEGQAILAYHFGKKMAARGRGGIILMGSLAGNAGSPSVIAYSGAKAFSQIFSEGLWWELRPKGVDVLHVVVGTTDTPAMARLGIIHHQGDSPDLVARLALEHVAKGPVVVVPGMRERFKTLATPDRRAATESNGELIMGSTKGTWIEAE
jgi:short-subunit dehydrogenase